MPCSLPQPLPLPRHPPSCQALRKPWRMQLIRQLSFGQRVSRANLSHFRAAQELAGEEDLQISL